MLQCISTLTGILRCSGIVTEAPLHGSCLSASDVHVVHQVSQVYFDIDIACCHLGAANICLKAKGEYHGVQPKNDILAHM